MSNDEIANLTTLDRRTAPVHAPGVSELRPGLQVTDRLRLVRPLADGGMASVWVADHQTLGIEVAVKFVLGRPDAVQRARLDREGRLAARVDHPHAVKILDQGLSAGGDPYLVMELLSGQGLDACLRRQGRLPLEDVRRLVAQVSGVLAAAHADGIVHRDIKPANIVLLDETGGLFAKVIDFGIAKPLGPEDTDLTGDGRLVGTPTYMAPEQLVQGRPADPRTDLWGLAVVAYEALTGRRAFGGPTRGAIGAAMVLGRYDQVCAIDPLLPQALDGWFARALHLDPAARFQSAEEFGRTFAEAASGPAGGAPARAPAHLSFPSRLYGRDRETTALLGSLRAASAGRSRVVLVGGYSGIGKTALVGELRRRLAGDRLVFVAGKFDPFDRGTPYQSVLQAFRALIRRVLASSPQTIEHWRARVIDALGDSGGVLIEVIGELGHLIGARPAPEPVPPSEARARFQLAIARLTTALASPEQPLVIFLDDLQWADLPSLELVTRLATDPESRHVLLIGAYRHNELDAAHPLTASIDHMRRVGAALDEIALGPLGEDAILDLITDTFPGMPGRMRLASICHARTRGNAFFLRRLLESLVEDGTVAFDVERDRWQWDERRIGVDRLSEDVVEFVAAEIGRMEIGCRAALAAAACVGDRFDLGALAVALGCDRGTALARIRPALATALVVAASERTPLPEHDPEEERLVFRFSHDRIRQAARAAIDDASAAAVHARVGLHLLETLRGAERERRFFEVVEHMNRGAVGASSPSEQARLRALNLEAARRAIRSAAFGAGDQYYRQARAHLRADAWTHHYAQTLALHVEGARAAWLAGDHAGMDALVERVVAHAKDPLDRLAAQEVRIQGLLSQQRFLEALELALELLRLLGLDLPLRPHDAAIGAAVGGTVQRLSEWSPERLAGLAVTDDPRVLARRRIETGAMSSAYMAAPKLLPLLACDIVRSTLEEGVCRDSPYGFAVLGLILNAVGQIDASYANGRIAREMLDRLGDRSIRPRTLHVVNAHVDLFVDPLRDTIEADGEVVRVGLDTGDLEYAAWALHCGVCNRFYAGVGLDELRGIYRRTRAILEHHQQLAALGCTLQYGQAFDNLTGAAPDPARLTGAHYDEVAQGAELAARNFRGAAYILAVVGAWVRYVFRDLEGARAFAEAGAPYADGAPATYHEVWWHQYHALAVLGAVDASDPAAVTRALRDVAPDVARLESWHRFSRVNHEHRLRLVEAELARVRGDTAAALALYEQAAASARAQRFTHEAALALELSARCLLARGDTASGRQRLAAARDAWAAWGATAKAARLAEEWEEL